MFEKFFAKFPIHAPKRKTLIKFLLLLSVFIAYFLYLSWKFDIETGGLVAVLSWSFFVLCTPVADAGFLLDFPVRLITNIRMIHSEMAVWAVAITLNALTLFFDPGIYDKTFLTALFYKILTTPYPYWGIIILCCLGTYTSIWFGDEVFDVVEDGGKKKKVRGRKFWLRLSLTAGLILLVGIVYVHLLETLGISLADIHGAD